MNWALFFFYLIWIKHFKLWYSVWSMANFDHLLEEKPIQITVTKHTQFGSIYLFLRITEECCFCSGLLQAISCHFQKPVVISSHLWRVIWLLFLSCHFQTPIPFHSLTNPQSHFFDFHILFVLQLLNAN